MIKTVIFDLGGVYFTDGTKNAIKIISESYNLDFDLVSDVFKGKIGTAYRESNITHEEFWNLAKEKLGIYEDTDKLAEIWLNGYVPINDTVEIIKQLKKKEYELLYLSDNVQERIDYIEERYHFLQYFKSGVFSHIVGVRKPNPEIYKFALEKSSNLADECVYIDDKENLLLPAKDIGMHTIHFTSGQALAEKLNELGIDVKLENK